MCQPVRDAGVEPGIAERNLGSALRRGVGVERRLEIAEQERSKLGQSEQQPCRDLLGRRPANLAG
jgi:hypothetical protein